MTFPLPTIAALTIFAGLGVTGFVAPPPYEHLTHMQGISLNPFYEREYAIFDAALEDYALPARTAIVVPVGLRADYLGNPIVDLLVAAPYTWDEVERIARDAGSVLSVDPTSYFGVSDDHGRALPLTFVFARASEGMHTPWLESTTTLIGEDDRGARVLLSIRIESDDPLDPGDYEVCLDSDKELTAFAPRESIRVRLSPITAKVRLEVRR